MHNIQAYQLLKEKGLFPYIVVDIKGCSLINICHKLISYFLDINRIWVIPCQINQIPELPRQY